MKKLLLPGIVIISSWVSAQQGNWCGINHVIEQRIDQDAHYRSALHQFMMNTAINSVGYSQQKSATITVPVVVHVIHDNGIGNISDAQIFSAIEVLNLDYARQNADTVDTRNTINAPFKPIAAGLDVEFRLAKIDPWGNCTNGIVRVNAPHLTYNAGENCKFDINGGSSAWPSDKYFNIWVVNTIDSEGAQGIIAGYAWYPNDISNNPGYGILMDDNYMGTIGTALYENGRVLTHEMGHALGLPHIFDEGWGGSTGCHSDDCNTAGDYICDTPPQTEASWNCSSTWNSCNLIPVNDAFGFDAYDQIENYMSYNSCQNMFSQGQCDVMEYNLNNEPELANMISVANIVATGVMSPDQLCMAEFETYTPVVCSGNTVQLLDYSFTGPTSWSWTLSPGTAGVDYDFTGGTISSDQNPQITFYTPGNYDITLTVSDGVSNQSQTKAGYIKVLPNTSSLPIIEGFEAYNTFAQTDYWVVSSSYPLNNEFELATGVGLSGNKCARLINYGQPEGSRDELQSSTIDLSSLDPLTDTITLSFRYAYRKRYAANDEWLKVYLTDNCGDTWVQRKTIHGNVLSPLTYPTPWTPTGPSDWTTVHMTNVTSSFWTDQFRYKFAFESDGGNNFYLDDINIYAGSPSEELVGTGQIDAEELSFSVYPNPVDEELNIRFFAGTDHSVIFVITDISGKVVERAVVNANTGSNLVLMDTGKLSSGMYFLNILGVKPSDAIRFTVE